MGYPNLEKFDVELLERTYRNLSSNSIENRFTQLINSMLGMIILPVEYNADKDLKPYSVKLMNIKLIKDMINQKLNITIGNQDFEYQKLYWPNIDYEKISLFEFILKMRHAVAHQNIKPFKEGSEWVGVVFRCYPRGSHCKKWDSGFTFQVCLTQEEIMKLFDVLFEQRPRENSEGGLGV